MLLSQEHFDALFVGTEGETNEVIPGTGICRIRRPPSGETEISRTTKQRRGQDFFREIVLNNYGNRCGLTALPIRELQIASRILPWSSDADEGLNVCKSTTQISKPTNSRELKTRPAGIA